MMLNDPSREPYPSRSSAPARGVQLAMARDNDGFVIPARVFEAAWAHKGVMPVCPRCGHYAVFQPHGLWWLCQTRRWDDRLEALKQRWFCSVCWTVDRQKVRPTRVELTTEASTVNLPTPEHAARNWKEELRRYRT